MTMPERVVLLKGPFTDDELRQIVDVMKAIESQRPDATFNIVIDAPEHDDGMDLLTYINPQRPGYSRTVKIFPRRQQ